MDLSLMLRIEWLDQDNAVRAMRKAEKHVGKLLSMIAEEPSKLPQIRHLSLARDYESLAQYYYALGFPISSVREHFAHASKAYRRVYELRGTERAFLAYTMTVNPNYPPDDTRSVVEFRPLHPEGSPDYSVTNSEDNFAAVCVALVGGDEEAAAWLASRAWDPPDASYIGPDSYCTPDGQRIAYSLREWYSGHTDRALVELRRVRRGKKVAKYAAIAKALQGTYSDDRAALLEGITTLLDWYRKRAAHWQYRNTPDYFLCLPALGIAKLAMQRGTVAHDDLPHDHVQFPLDLLP